MSPPVRTTAEERVDMHLGRAIRRRRKIVGMTQAQLATHLGMRFQQVQKYEVAANRISASRLFSIAAVLQVPVAEFFAGLEPR